MEITDINGIKRECLKVTSDPSYPGFVRVDYIPKYRKGDIYSEWYPIDQFLAKNPKFKKAFAKTEIKEDLGVVGYASSLTLVDRTKKWKSNIFKDITVWISRGKGEGQTRKIISNSEDTIIIDKPWKTVPDKTSQYVISNNVNDPQILGNTLPEVKEEKKIKKKKLDLKIVVD
ncbi:MAG: hypothetical protein ACPLY7_02150 [Microgenomates group bacterium]